MQVEEVMVVEGTNGINPIHQQIKSIDDLETNINKQENDVFANNERNSNIEYEFEHVDNEPKVFKPLDPEKDL